MIQKSITASVVQDKTEYKLSEPIEFSFNISNNSDKPMTLWQSGFWPNHIIEVYNSKEMNLKSRKKVIYVRKHLRHQVLGKKIPR